MGAGRVNLLELAESIGVTGFLHCDELQKLVELAAGKDVLEVGSFKGLSAWGMAFVAKSLTCCDSFAAATDGQRQTGETTTLGDFLRATDRYSNVKHYQLFSEDAARVIEGDFDFIFVDATHTYHEVKADIERWWPRVRSGGVMALHDVGHRDFPGVQQAVDEVFGPAPEGTTVVTLRWVTKT